MAPPLRRRRAIGVVCHWQNVSEPVSLRMIRSLLQRHAVAVVSRPSPSLPPPSPGFLLRSQMLSQSLPLLSKLICCSVWSAWSRLSCRKCGKILFYAIFSFPFSGLPGCVELDKERSHRHAPHTRDSSFLTQSLLETGQDSSSVISGLQSVLKLSPFPVKMISRVWWRMPLNPGTEEAKAGESLWVWSHLGVYSKF